MPNHTSPTATFCEPMILPEVSQRARTVTRTGDCLPPEKRRPGRVENRKAATRRGWKGRHAALGCWRRAYPYAQVSRERNKSQDSLNLTSQTFRWRQKTIRSVDAVRKRSGRLEPSRVKFHTVVEVV